MEELQELRELREAFQASAKLIKTKLGPISNEDLLTLYGLYKQITQGDCNEVQPWSVQIQARQKWDAWFKCRNMEKGGAMKKYIDKVNELMQTN